MTDTDVIEEHQTKESVPLIQQWHQILMAHSVLH